MTVGAIAALTSATPVGAGEVGALRASLIDGQPPPFQRLSVQTGDRSLGVLTLSQFDKTKTARLPGDLVPNNHCRCDLEARR